MPRIRAERQWPQGRVRRFKHRSAVLKSNPWGDPVERILPVYLPPGYDESSEACPVFWNLAPFTNSGPGQLNWKNFSESLPQRLDRLIGEGVMGPVVVACPDCFTSLGGNQYLNSPAVGRYADYLLEELVPLVEAELRVLPGPEHRAAFGKSSGGYGALYHAMHYAEHWGAVASHAGDVGFDLCYRSDFGNVLTTLAEYKGDLGRFLQSFWKAEKVSDEQIGALMMLAMAASYDPDPDQPLGFGLPLDLETGEMNEKRWARWLAHDPLNMVENCADRLRTLRGIYIDCGDKDQFHMQYGSRLLSRKLKALGIEHVYEEFDGTHSGIDHRLDVSLPYLYWCLMRA